VSALQAHHATLLEVLARHDVRFVLVGGAALQLHGYTGFTHDVDVTIAVDAANGQRVEAALEALRAQPYLPGPRGSSYRTGFGRIEVMRETAGPGDYDGWMQKAVQIEIAPEVTVWVGSASDLLLSKEQAARPKDLDALPQIRAELQALGTLAPEDIRGPVVRLPAERTPDPRLVELLGDRPTDPRTRGLWDHAAQMITDYRKLWNLADADDLLGPLPPTGTPQAADRASLDRHLERLDRMLNRGRDDLHLER
jgi:hypothetical protein